MTISFHRSAPPFCALALRINIFAFIAIALAGCTDRLVTGSTGPTDYKLVHPIILGERPVTLDVSPAAKLDAGSRRRLAQFAAEAKEEGAERIEVLVPVGAVNEAQTRAALPAIKAALQESGGISAISIGSYPPLNSADQSPLRLSYRAVRAAVAHGCGQWPADLASGASLESWENRPYWNYGCAYQNMIATQVDDPRDLEAPRASTPGDIRTRSRAIEKVRQGADPTTQWSTPPIGIGTVGTK